MDNFINPDRLPVAPRRQEQSAHQYQQQHLRDWEKAINAVSQAKSPMLAIGRPTAAPSLQTTVLPEHRQKGGTDRQGLVHESATPVLFHPSLVSRPFVPQVNAYALSSHSPTASTPYSQHGHAAPEHNRLLQTLSAVPLLREHLPRQRLQIIEHEPGCFTLRLRDFYASQEQLLAQLQAFIQTTETPIHRLIINGQRLELTFDINKGAPYGH